MKPCLRATPYGSRVSASIQALTGRYCCAPNFGFPASPPPTCPDGPCSAVESRGKHLLTRLEGDLTLHTHFEMDGTWHVYRPTQRWRGPSYQVRVVLENADSVCVGFRLPVVEIDPDQRRGFRRSGTSVRTCSRPQWGPTMAAEVERTAAAAAHARGRQRAARSAQPGRPWQPVALRGALPARDQPVHPGQQGGRPAEAHRRWRSRCSGPTVTGPVRAPPDHCAAARTNYVYARGVPAVPSLPHAGS